jgi:shikimate kinase
MIGSGKTAVGERLAARLRRPFYDLDQEMDNDLGYSYAWNVDILRGTGVTVLLEADLKTLADRVRKADRPRVNSGVSLEEDLESIWSTAGHLYRQAADLVYRTDAVQGIDAEVADLLNLLAQRLGSGWESSCPVSDFVVREELSDTERKT